ncbi:MAG: hypothetical protein LC808_14015 [Actinobacteria bacterium]|nr:hypothetical protein [Actinomycetota bacterium]
MTNQPRTVAEPAVMQRDNEISRVVVEGRRTDDGDRCTLVVIQEWYGGGWALYPHGWGTFGVRLEKSAAATVARAILAEDAQ